ncbi:MAG TPA: flagellar basal body rod protein FlgB [Firmicutes bacterium]|nr:flagellar basal body rod protein FlgB [Bacillota bacterium]
MAGITNLMQRGLDGLWLRHEVLANNVANSETPGYKKKDLSFSSYLQNAMGPCSSLTTTNHLHIQRPNIETVQVNQDTSSVTPDGNSVDIDKEMAEVSANAFHYISISRQLAAHFSLLRKAISEGRR